MSAPLRRSGRLSVEQANVYWGGGRRWLSPLSAARAEARKAIKRHCECERGDDITPGVTCHLHEPGRFERLQERLAKRYMRAFVSLRTRAARGES